MDRRLLTPAQRRVVDDLLGLGQPRPCFDLELVPQLRDELEEALAPALEGLAPGELPWVTKHGLAEVHACEAHHRAQVTAGFQGWTASSARGSVIHKALELSVAFGGEPVPLELVNHAMASLAADDRRGSPRPWLLEASPLELAELRAGANDVVVKFLECWPPLQPSWSPRAETGIGVDLCDGRVVLWAKVDLVLGRARGNEARSLVVDLKTGRPYPHHVDDLRLYALVQALRLGVPPFRVASYYLDLGDWQAETVDEEGLALTVRRVADGVAKMAELHLGARRPTVTPGPRCGWCPVRDGCEGARRWRSRHDDDADADAFDVSDALGPDGPPDGRR